MPLRQSRLQGRVTQYEGELAVNGDALQLEPRAVSISFS